MEFRCNASGLPAPTIVWERLGSNLPNDALDRDGILMIPSVGAEDAGTYSCKAVNSEGQDSFSVKLEGPCGFRPFDFYSKLKIENQKFTIVIFNV